MSRIDKYRCSIIDTIKSKRILVTINLPLSMLIPLSMERRCKQYCSTILKSRGEVINIIKFSIPMPTGIYLQLLPEL